MSVAKKAVDSTIKRILIYTGEIIASIVLLVVICLPLAFSVPMWIQRVGFGTAVENLIVNPVAWFGVGGFLIAIVGLAIVSFVIGYPMLMKLIPGEGNDFEVDDVEDEEDEEDLEEEEASDIEEEEDAEVSEVEASDEEEEISNED